MGELTGDLVERLRVRLDEIDTAMRAIVEEHAPQVRPILEIQGKAVMSEPECRVCADWDEADYDGPPHVKAPCRTLLLVARALGVAIEE